MIILLFKRSQPIKFVTVITLILTLAGCSSLTAKDAQVKVDFKQPIRIHFSGKGAGAGMMLMSAMGPMGVAIGVAIDEGIAKDIQSAFDATGAELSQYLRNQFAQSCAANSQSPRHITVSRVEFKMVQGDGAAVMISGLISAGREDAVLGADIEAINRNHFDLTALKQDGFLVRKAIAQEVLRICRES